MLPFLAVPGIGMGSDLAAVPVMLYFTIGTVRFFNIPIVLVRGPVVQFVRVSRSSIPSSIVPPIIVQRVAVPTVATTRPETASAVNYPVA